MSYTFSAGTSRPLALRLTVWVTAVLFPIISSGCFNTYTLTAEEFGRLQRPDEVPKVVSSEQGASVAVTRETPIYVRSTGGRRYPVTPFNFKLTKNQLVASDRDIIMFVSDLQSYEVDLLSTGKTAILGAVGVAITVGLIAATLATAGEQQLGE